MNEISQILELIKNLDKTNLVLLRNELDRMNGSVSIVFDDDYVDYAISGLNDSGELEITPDEIDDIVRFTILQSAVENIVDGVDFLRYFETEIKHYLYGKWDNPYIGY